MNPAIYNSCTLILYAVEVVLALSIDSIGPLFGFIGTFSGVGISYILPSLFLKKGFELFAEEKFKKENGRYITLANINLALGVFFFFLFLANNILYFISFTADVNPTVFCNSKG
jgi:hypothetical protein